MAGKKTGGNGTRTDAPVLNRKYEKNLECKLTEDEVLAKGRELALEQDELDEAERQKKRVTEDAKAAVEERRGRVRTLSRIVRDGSEDRRVGCEEYLDFANQRAYTVRMDTGEEVETRPLSEFERQRKLPMETPVRPAPARLRGEPRGPRMKIPMQFPQKEADAFVVEARRQLIVALRDNLGVGVPLRTLALLLRLADALGCTAKEVESAYKRGAPAEETTGDQASEDAAQTA